jgi:glucosamine--fructose-6-phosphate aminotransferase (isomerizing)
MCGIVGYIGNRNAQQILLSGLRRLEYRGYDSAGMATYLPHKNALSLRKLSGKVKRLEGLLKKKPLAGVMGIAQTRWATHGAPNRINAHPHLDCKREIALVHNGIIENYAQLKKELIKKGHRFSSQTDTEVIPHLIEEFYDNRPLEEALREALSRLEGSFAVAVISRREPEKLVGARMGSPLIVGVNREENFLASDVPAVLEATKDVIFLDEQELAVLTKEGLKITNFNGREVSKKPTRINWDISSAQKQGFKHFMLKEIYEQPKVLRQIFSSYLKKNNCINFGDLGMSAEFLKALSKIVIVACGTAYHAGLVGKYAIEELAGIPVAVELSSEFRYRRPLIDQTTLVVAISQSGETADTLAAVGKAKQEGARILAICNVLGSSLTRQSDSVLYTLAGPEVGVASTKAYTAQLAVVYLLALYLAEIKQAISANKRDKLTNALKASAGMQEEMLNSQLAVKTIARRHSHFGSFLFLGRHINFPSALEGALKLKEISYIPAEGYAAGEMKHGPIALIDEYRAVVCIAPDSAVYAKMVSNIQEIRSRRGKIIALVSEGDEKIKELTPEVVYLPKIEAIFSPLIVALPLQLLAYHIAAKRGCDVDQPRNLAKSVTVE